MCTSELWLRVLILTGSLDGERLALGTLNELLADLLERGNLAGAEGDTDLVDFLQGDKLAIDAICECFVLFGRKGTNRALAEILLGLLERHFDRLN